MDEIKPPPKRGPHRRTGRPKGRPHHKTRSEQREADYKHQLANRGQKLGKERCEEILQYFMGLVARYQPLGEGGQAREGGDWDRFKEAVDYALRAIAIVIPYQSPRLAAVTVSNEERDDEPMGDMAVWELRALMVKRGIPVDHLRLEHSPVPAVDETVEFEHGPNGGGGNGRG